MTKRSKKNQTELTLKFIINFAPAEPCDFVDGPNWSLIYGLFH